MTYIVGITGGIATGKSTVTRYIAQEGYSTLDADQVAAQVMAEDRVKNLLAQSFGQSIIALDGSLDRQVLSRIVFSKPDQLAILNALVHPLVFQKIEEYIRECQDLMLFIEMPLLFESGHLNLYNETWLVYVDPALQLKRLMERNNFSQLEAESRIKAQMPMSVKQARADYLIDNSGDLERTYQQVHARLQDLQNKL